MAQPVSRRRPVTVQARIRTRVSLSGICGGQSGTGTGFSPSYSVFPCQYHSTVAFNAHMASGAAVQRHKSHPFDMSNNNNNTAYHVDGYRDGDTFWHSESCHCYTLTRSAVGGILGYPLASNSTLARTLSVICDHYAVYNEHYRSLGITMHH
jgi:hypothetical protein